MKFNGRGLVGVLAGLVAVAAWVFIPGDNDWLNDFAVDGKALVFLFILLAVIGIIILIARLLNKEIQPNHRRRNTVFRMLLPYALVAIATAVLVVYIAPKFAHFNITVMWNWLTGFWDWKAFLADVIAFTAIALAVFWPSPKPTRTDTTLALTPVDNTGL